MAKMRTEKIEMRNVNHPGKVTRVDADMYNAMKLAVLKTLPRTPPGLTADEVREGVLAYLPDDLYPAGTKAGWWTKAVQLDLEAKGLIVREKTRPLRLHRA